MSWTVKSVKILMLVAILFSSLFVPITQSQVAYANVNSKPNFDPFGLTEGNPENDFSQLINKIFNWVIGISLSASVISGGLLAFFLNFIALGQNARQTAKAWGFGIIIGLLLIASLVTLAKVIYNMLQV
ncbi:hypothetical protein [Brevibacillus borstelensis]|uniref:hypothetical protein n=1 Tax=Brevibacillus borstelensis TaxID=45462 RepID=UPI000468F170|nr:hypothetical protein [Brevibacillus borstelensis]